MVEVPDVHGRLIDVNALLDGCSIHWSQTTGASCVPVDDIDDAPTIIPATIKVKMEPVSNSYKFPEVASGRAYAST